MPTFTELLERHSRGELSRDQVIIVSPEDFRSLRQFLDGEDAPDMATLSGVRVVVSSAIPMGTVNIVDQWRPSLLFREVLDLPAFRGAFVPSPQGPATVVPPSEPEKPEPRSLWERLDEDE